MPQTSTNFEKFADILEQKIRKQIEAEMSPKPSEKQPQHNEAADLLGQLLTAVNPVHFSTRSGLQRYPHKAVKPKPRPAHKLNGEQCISYDFMLRQGSPLANNFNRKELESAFRALALKLHPDQGGSTEMFRKLLEARKVLSGLL